MNNFFSVNKISKKELSLRFLVTPKGKQEILKKVQKKSSNLILLNRVAVKIIFKELNIINNLLL